MTLARRIGPALLTLYGVGVMVGAGIYVLVGAIAGIAGPATPLAFALAGLTASFSAWSFAELSARIPRSAGEAAYVEAAFGSVTLATMVGFAVVSVGVVSAAAILKGGVGYLMGFVSLPRAVLEPAVLLGLTLLAMRGVAESLMAAAALTIVEVAGLIVVAAVGLGAETVTPVAAMLDPSAFAEAGAAAVLSATLLAFFAYVGFEDMVNMAEETVDPARTMPRAILAAVTVTTLLYMLVSVAALHAVPQDALGESERPLALVFTTATGLDDAPILAIAVVATLNGVLVQLIMVSRVLYGMAERRPWLGWFRVLHPSQRAPQRGTALAALVVLCLAAAAPIDALAEATSRILLVIFVVVNAALFVLKRRSAPPEGAPTAPLIVPALGLSTALFLLVA
jgi:amino acid transporter